MMRLLLALALSSAALAGCGARSALVDGVSAVDVPDAATCAPASPAPSSQRFGDAAWQIGAAIAVDGNGYPILAGAFSGTLDLGGGAVLQAPGPPAVPLQPPDLAPSPIGLAGTFFLARLAPADCAPFARAFSPMKHEADSIQIALAADESILLAAQYTGDVDFGGGPIANAALVKFTAAGEHALSERISAGRLALSRPVSDAQGNIFVAGVFSGSLAIGGASLGKSPSSTSLADAFVAKLDPAGTLVWSKILRLGSPWEFARLAVAAWPTGEIAVAGQFVHDVAVPVDLGAGPETFSPHQTGFVTSFDASGQHRWKSLMYPLTSDARIGPKGDLVITGVWDGFGFPIQRFDLSGATNPSVTAPAPASIAVQLAVGADDEAIVGAQLYPPVSGLNGVVATSMAPSGEVLWIHQKSPAEAFANYRVAIDAGKNGVPMLAGAFTDTLDFGFGPLTAAGGEDAGSDLFLVSFEP
ncbi:MAG: hypothetical protein QM820_13960 [Minicystis sp.]